jgi:propanediol dehydratase large subunit
MTNLREQAAQAVGAVMREYGVSLATAQRLVGLTLALGDADAVERAVQTAAAKDEPWAVEYLNKRG